MYVSDRDMGARCDIYVGVIVWSVMRFFLFFSFFQLLRLFIIALKGFP